MQNDGACAHQDSQPHDAVYHRHRPPDGRHHDDAPLDHSPGALPTCRPLIDHVCRSRYLMLMNCRKAQLCLLCWTAVCLVKQKGARHMQSAKLLRCVQTLMHSLHAPDVPATPFPIQILDTPSHRGHILYTRALSLRVTPNSLRTESSNLMWTMMLFVSMAA